jgi:6-pyruvoyl-tetrahydropterin synthase
MSLLIVTSRYLKSGTAKTKSQRKNYTKYIATRESVEVREQSKKYSTENQKKLLNELLNDFPESKKYLEFEDYKNNPTAENIARWVCEQIPTCFKVEVRESEGNTVIYEKD